MDQFVTLISGLYMFVIGASIGSFLNVLIDRLPHNETILGRSHCDHCKKQLSGRDLVPVFSLVLYGGKSRCCQKPLSMWYPLIEILTGILFVVVTFIPLKQLSLTASITSQYELYARILLLVLTSCVVVIIGADMKYRIIPDSMQIIVIIVGVLFTILFHMPTEWYVVFRTLGMRIVESIGVMAPMYVIYFVTRGKGMGFGDVKLAVGIGMVLGFTQGLLALYIAFLSGAVVGLALMSIGMARRKSKIAFGPFLVFGFTIMIVKGSTILEFLQKYFY